MTLRTLDPRVCSLGLVVSWRQGKRVTLNLWRWQLTWSRPDPVIAAAMEKLRRYGVTDPTPPSPSDLTNTPRL